MRIAWGDIGAALVLAIVSFCFYMAVREARQEFSPHPQPKPTQAILNVAAPPNTKDCHIGGPAILRGNTVYWFCTNGGLEWRQLP